MVLGAECVQYDGILALGKADTKFGQYDGRKLAE